MEEAFKGGPCLDKREMKASNKCSHEPAAITNQTNLLKDAASLFQGRGLKTDKHQEEKYSGGRRRSSTSSLPVLTMTKNGKSPISLPLETNSSLNSVPCTQRTSALYIGFCATSGARWLRKVSQNTCCKDKWPFPIYLWIYFHSQ